MSSGHAETQRPRFFFPNWVWFVIIGAIVLFIFAHFNKNWTIEDVRLKCIKTFENAPRCECISDQLKERTSIITFLPLLRRFTGPSQHMVEELIRESAMACIFQDNSRM